MNIDDWTGTEISDDIIEQAAHWVAALDLDNTTEQMPFESTSSHVDTQLTFYAWLNQDPVHQMAFAQVSELWAKMACLKHVEHLLEPSQVLAFTKRTSASNTSLLSDAPLLQEQHIEAAAPAWAYNIVIATVCVGFLLSFVPLPLV